MKKYCLQMHCTNFLIESNGKNAKHGFYKSLQLEASSPEEAEELAVRMLREDNALIEITLNEAGDSPLIYLEEIAEVDEIDKEVNDYGKVWYAEDDNKKWWQFWN